MLNAKLGRKVLTAVLAILLFTGLILIPQGLLSPISAATLVIGSTVDAAKVDADGYPIPGESTPCKITDIMQDGHQTISTSGSVYLLEGTHTGIITVAGGTETTLVLNGYTRTNTAALPTATLLASPLIIGHGASVTIVIVGDTENSFICNGTSSSTSIVQSGIYVSGGAIPTPTGQPATLVIKREYGTPAGSLTAEAGGFSAGIGGGANKAVSGTIIIEGGNIIASTKRNPSNASPSGSANGAGIGGGGGNSIAVDSNTQPITICGDAHVTATSAGRGAGIGGGGTNINNSAGSNHAVNICGNAVVIAESKNGGAGIGGGGTKSTAAGAGGIINIYGNANVTAKSSSTAGWSNDDNLGAGGPAIGGGGTITSTPGAGGTITISGSPTIVAAAGNTDALSIGAGYRTTGGGYGTPASITITGGNVQANHVEIGTVTNGTSYGGDALFMTTIDYGAESLTDKTYNIKGSGGDYTYAAKTNTFGKNYIWIPKEKSTLTLTKNPTAKVYLTDDVVISADAESKSLDKVVSMQWFRTNITDTATIIDATDFDPAYNSATAANRGDVVLPTPYPDDNTFTITTDQNAKYWVKVTFVDVNGTHYDKIDSIIVNNFYTPIQVLIRDMDTSDSLPGRLAKIYTLISGTYGIPYDLNGSVIPDTSADFLGYDEITYTRNINMPGSHWVLDLPAAPVFTNASSDAFKLMLDGDVEAGTDSDTGTTDVIKYYTAEYTRIPGEWCELDVTFVDAIGGIRTINGATTSRIFVPLDSTSAPITANSFYGKGGFFVPPTELGLDLEARGWYINKTPHTVTDVTQPVAIPDYYFKQNFWEAFDPKLGTLISGSPVYTLDDNRILYIVYSAPAVRIVENHYDKGTVNDAHAPSATVVELGATTYYKQALTTIPNKVCVGYEIVFKDGTATKDVPYVLPYDMPPDASQLDLVFAEITVADNIDVYANVAEINFFYETAVNGVPISEAAYLTTRWRGEVNEGNYNMTAQTSVTVATRFGVGRTITRTNDGSPLGDINHIIEGELDNNKWYYDSVKTTEGILQSWTPLTLNEEKDIIFYYSFSTNGLFVDKDQYITEKYKTIDGAAIPVADTKTMLFVNEKYEKTAPKIDGYVEAGTYRGDYAGTGMLTALSFDFTRDPSPANEIVTFVYRPAAQLTVECVAITGSLTTIPFPDEIINGVDGQVVTVTPPLDHAWVLESVELNGTPTTAPYDVTLRNGAAQTIKFYYRELYADIRINGLVNALDGEQLYSLSLRLNKEDLVSSYTVSQSLLPVLAPEWVLKSGELGKLTIDSTTERVINLLYESGHTNVTVYMKDFFSSENVLAPVVFPKHAIGTIFTQDSPSIPGYQLLSDSGDNALPFTKEITSVSAVNNSVTFYYKVAVGNQLITYWDLDEGYEIGRELKQLETGIATTIKAPDIDNYAHDSSEPDQEIVTYYGGAAMPEIKFHYTRDSQPITLIAYDTATGNPIPDASNPITYTIPAQRVLENYDFEDDINDHLNDLVPSNYSPAARASTLHNVSPNSAANTVTVWYVPQSTDAVRIEVRIVKSDVTYDPNEPSTYHLLQSYTEPAKQGDTVDFSGTRERIPNLEVLGYIFDESLSNLSAEAGTSQRILLVYTDDRYITTIRNDQDDIVIVDRTVNGHPITLYPPYKEGFYATKFSLDNGITVKDFPSGFTGHTVNDKCDIIYYYERQYTAPTTGSIAILVTNSAGVPLPNATVTVTIGGVSSDYTTNASGTVFIPHAAFGNYTIRARLSGYNSADASVTLNETNHTQSVVISLGRTNTGGGNGGGGGIIIDGNKPSIASLAIQCINENGQVLFSQSLTAVIGRTETIMSPPLKGADLAAGETESRNITIAAGLNLVKIRYTSAAEKTVADADTSGLPERPAVSAKVKGMLETAAHVAYINGYPDGSIKPDGSITRAEAAMIFWRLIKDPQKNNRIDGTFSDVQNDQWHAQAINYLAKIGIINGYENGTFLPNSNITRAEFTAIVARFDDLSIASRNPFTDLASEHWAFTYIISAESKGLLSGYGSVFAPDKMITRAESVRIINLMLGRGIRSADIASGMGTKFTDLDASHPAFAEIIEASSSHNYKRIGRGYEQHLDD